jgi:hypothetical protein
MMMVGLRGNDGVLICIEMMMFGLHGDNDGGIALSGGHECK